jgi:hypothetical protein
MFRHPAMISATLSTLARLVSFVLTRARRRRRGRHEAFDLGTVSQQWLLVHKGEER